LLELPPPALGECAVQRSKRGRQLDEIAAHGMTWPPFTSRICPVTNPDSASEAR
jgi:hypothetical protein